MKSLSCHGCLYLRTSGMIKALDLVIRVDLDGVVVLTDLAADIDNEVIDGLEGSHNFVCYGLTPSDAKLCAIGYHAECLLRV